MSPLQALPFPRSRHAFTGMLVGVALCSLPATVRAHGDLDGQITAVTQQIDETPTAVLYLRRGELHHEHADFPAALADYNRATAADPQLDAVWLNRARTLFQVRRLQAAREAATRYLESKPTHAEAFLLRARVLVGLEEYAAAVEDFERNLALTSQPLPECFLERAEALAAAGDKVSALRGLDEGIDRLGNLVTLQSAALALEMELNRHDAALARIDRVMSMLRRKEVWLTRRGEVLEAAGRRAEALHAYADALAALEQLAAQHRNVKPMQELETRLRQLLGS